MCWRMPCVRPAHLGKRMHWTVAPARAITAALLLALALMAVAMGVALWQPWLGLSLRAELAPATAAPAAGNADAGPGRIVVAGIARHGPAAAATPPIPAGARLLRIAQADVATQASAVHAPIQAVTLEPDDLIEEPDFFDSYADMRRLFARQDRIAHLLQAPVALHWVGANGVPQTTAVTAAAWRPLHTLPFMFWFQLAVGALAWLLSAWVWVLRPHDWAARMLAAAGLLLLVTTAAAAVYSARELALPGGLFRGLSAINHLGAISFGMALVGLFMMYPRPIAPPSSLLALPLVFLPWWVLDTWHILPNQNWGGRLPILLEMMLAIVVAVVQWHRSRLNPADRAAMRWFNVSALFGCLLFAASTVGSHLLGLLPPMPQGYAFGFFLVLFGGLAFGVGRYRLFDLDRWAFRILLWALGAAAVVAMDFVLVLVVGFTPDLSLALSLLVYGVLYWPMRQWLWGRMVQKPALPMEQALPRLVDVAFTPGALAREQRWLNLLQSLYAPLQLLPQQQGANPAATLRAEGLELLVPETGGLGARLLVGRSAGMRLFSPQDVAFAQSLCDLLDKAAGERDAYVRGVEQERSRIAQDLHDELGAKLLMALHSTSDARQKALLEDAVAQMRLIVRGLAQAEQPMTEFLADLRHDAFQRLAAAGMQLDWNLDPVALHDLQLDARQQYQLRALLHEAVSNSMRHAMARRVSISLASVGGHLRLQIADDGTGFDPAQVHEGQGLRNMRARARALGGEVRWRSDAQSSVLAQERPGRPSAAPGAGTQVEIDWPEQPWASGSA